MPCPVPHPRHAPGEVVPYEEFPVAPLREHGDDDEDCGGVAGHADLVPELRAGRSFGAAAHGRWLEVGLAFGRDLEIRTRGGAARVDRLHADLVRREVTA